MTDGSEGFRFCARMSALPAILGCVREACREAGIVPPAALRAELAIEELFTNTVRHGYKEECDHPVWLHALASPGTLCLTYQDAAGEFDPLGLPPAGEGAVACIGGLGIRLVRGVATGMGYRRDEGRNTLTLLFAAAPP
jgi:anti-sigma regulatory factor (Ser/Thr protein kinase)